MGPFARRARLERVLAWTGLALSVLLAFALQPILHNEVSCMAPAATPRPPAVTLIEPAHRRDEVNTYLTYPEWSIVHAYEDLAAVTRTSREADYDAFGAVFRYWSSLCSISRFASSRGPISTDYKVMLYTIGLSFSIEMGIKGLYEKTIGRATSVLAGGRPTPEDAFALAVAEDYARFLRQVPWYEYPFGTTLWRFWRETPIVGGNALRKIERRMALSLEWGTKAIYAKVIALGAAASPAPLRIRSVVMGLTDADLAADPRITLVARYDDRAVIETDRYATFTSILVGLAARGRDIVEIAGNRHIMVTVLSPQPELPSGLDAKLLLAVPVAARPGWHRLALDVKMKGLAPLLRGTGAHGLVLDHVYDY
jgi:hypothetical protein